MRVIHHVAVWALLIPSSLMAQIPAGLSSTNPGPSDATGSLAGGHGTILTGQVSVGTTPTLVVAARPGRQKLIIIVGAANPCAFGNSSVTITTGLAPLAVAGAAVTFDSAAALYGACATATPVSWAEEF